MEAALEKKKKLIEEKTTMSLNADGTERIMTRTLRKRGTIKDAKDQGAYKKRLNPPNINYQLRENEIADDLGTIQRALPINTPALAATTRYAPGKLSSEVYTDRGRLYFHSQVFEKGRDVFIESKQENGKWHGVIIVVNPAEIHIKSVDGTKSRFSMSQLRNGRYAIMAAS